MDINTFKRNWALHYIQPEYLYLPGNQGDIWGFFTNGIYKGKNEDNNRHISTEVIGIKKPLVCLFDNSSIENVINSLEPTVYTDEEDPFVQIAVTPYNGGDFTTRTLIFQKTKEIDNKNYTLEAYFQLIPVNVVYGRFSRDSSTYTKRLKIFSRSYGDVIFLQLFCEEDSYMIEMAFPFSISSGDFGDFLDIVDFSKNLGLTPDDPYRGMRVSRTTFVNNVSKARCNSSGLYTDIEIITRDRQYKNLPYTYQDTIRTLTKGVSFYTPNIDNCPTKIIFSQETDPILRESLKSVLGKYFFLDIFKKIGED